MVKQCAWLSAHCFLKEKNSSYLETGEIEKLNIFLSVLKRIEAGMIFANSIDEREKTAKSFNRIKKGGIIMREKTFTIKNDAGLHARPASRFVSCVTKFKSQVKVICNESTYNARSMLSILSMGAKKGDVITIVAQGEDEVEIIDALSELIESGLDE